ncbi:unnamed protein product [Gordionus sp. m RMFG-2023]
MDFSLSNSLKISNRPHSRSRKLRLLLTSSSQEYDYEDPDSTMMSVNILNELRRDACVKHPALDEIEDYLADPVAKTTVDVLGSGSGVLKGEDVIYIENYSWLKENVENITKFSESSLILTQTNEYENSHLGTAESYLNQIANPVFELDALDQDTTNKENENPIIIKNIPTPIFKRKKLKVIESERTEILKEILDSNKME